MSVQQGENEHRRDKSQPGISLPINENVQDMEPEAPVIEPEAVERFEPSESKTRGSSQKQGARRQANKAKSISQLHKELRKHSESRMKTDLAVRGIEKQLKALLLAHHSAIKDLQKQLSQMRRKIAAIESSKKYRKGKTTPTKKKIRLNP